MTDKDLSHAIELQSHLIQLTRRISRSPSDHLIVAYFTQLCCAFGGSLNMVTQMQFKVLFLSPLFARLLACQFDVDMDNIVTIIQHISNVNHVNKTDNYR